MNRNITLSLSLVFGLLIGLSTSLFGEPPEASKKEEAHSLPLDELRLFAEIFGRIKNDYVEPVDDRTLLENAIRGMLSRLDPHSAYLDQEAFHELRIGTSGEFGGLGIEIGTQDGFIKVIAPIDDTPAERAGIQAGDLIVRIDGKPAKGMSLEDAVKLMRGKPGTKIKLSLLREGQDAPIQVEITRAIIHITSVKRRLLQPGYGYIRIAHFQSDTPGDLLKAISELEEENHGELRGLILDLRNNPGGVLNSAVGVSDAFLRGGLIVSTKGRISDSVLEFKAGPDDVLDGKPLVVLVNRGSASASEIVAGALQDHRRALILGTRTFGKGSVQTIIPIDNVRGLKLTTARYYTPSGRSIQAHGIQPDIVLQGGHLKVETSGSANSLREADLPHHLDDSGTGKEENPDRGTEGARDDASEPEEKEPEEKETDADRKSREAFGMLEDYQLNEALNILRALTLFETTQRNP